MANRFVLPPDEGGLKDRFVLKDRGSTSHLDDISVQTDIKCETYKHKEHGTP